MHWNRKMINLLHLVLHSEYVSQRYDVYKRTHLVVIFNENVLRSSSKLFMRLLRWLKFCEKFNYATFASHDWHFLTATISDIKVALKPTPSTNQVVILDENKKLKIFEYCPRAILDKKKKLKFFGYCPWGNTRWK